MEYSKIGQVLGKAKREQRKKTTIRAYPSRAQKKEKMVDEKSKKEVKT